MIMRNKKNIDANNSIIIHTHIHMPIFMYVYGKTGR